MTSLVWASLADWLSFSNDTASDAADRPLISVSRLVLIEVWLTGVAFVHLLGVLLRRSYHTAALAVVDWLCRPFILLYVIVFSTVGFYINVYTLDVRPLWTTVLVACAPPVCGLVVGALAAVLGVRLAADDGCGWSGVATETAVLNCGAVLTMIRFAVESDVDADVFSSPAFWTTFAILLIS